MLDAELLISLQFRDPDLSACISISAYLFARDPSMMMVLVMIILNNNYNNNKKNTTKKVGQSQKSNSCYLQLIVVNRISNIST